MKYPQIGLAGLLLGLAVPSLAQDIPSRPASPQPIQSLDHASIPSPDPDRQQVHWDEQEQVTWIRGADYKASFGAEGVQFIPFLGSDAPRNFPLAFGVPSSTVGGVTIPTHGDQPAQREGNRVILDRGSMDEWYVVSPGSIEQRFTMQASQGSGDWVVDIPVATELVPVEHQGGFRFQNELGGVDYGAATVLDAQGAYASAPVSWTGSSLQIRVDSAFLAGAQWPVTIDPVITVFAADTFTADLTQADVSFDASTNSFVVVYQENFSGGDGDIYYRQFDAVSLTVTDEGYIHTSTGDHVRPRIANHAAADNFLVVCQRDLNPGYTVVSRTLSATNGDLGFSWGIDATEFVYHLAPDVGGNFVGLGSDYYVVYLEDDFFGSRRLLGTRIASDGQPSFNSIVLQSNVVNAHTPAISNSLFPTNYWNIVWSEGNGTSRDIWATAVDSTGTVVINPFLVDNISGDNVRPTVSPSAPGVEDSFVVAYENEISGLPNIIRIALVHTDLVTTTVVKRHWLDTLDLNKDQRNARIDRATDSRTVIVWDEEVAPGDRKIYTSTLNESLENLCESERRILTSTGTPNSASHPSVATAYSSFSSSIRSYIAWHEQDGTNQDIWAATFDASLYNCVGWMSCNNPIANSTGQHSLIYGEGLPIAGTPTFTLRANRLPNNQFGYFVAGTAANTFGIIPPGSEGKLCLSGTLGRFNRNTSEILNTGGIGEMSLVFNTLDMPTGSPILSGQTLHFQGWHRDLNPAQTSNFTPLLSVTFE